VAFEVLGKIWGVEPIATGRGIREVKRLRRKYGRSRWRKRKGFATVRLSAGRIRWAELHWYEAHGIGATELKVKKILGEP
jgi:hypothetical protein